MKILVLPKYGPKGPSSRVRFYQYFPYLQSVGVRLTVAPLLDDDYVTALFSGERYSIYRTFRSYLNRVVLLVKRKQFDLIWVENELLHYLPFLFEQALYQRYPPIAVNYDDAVFHHYEMHPHGLFRWLLGRKIDRVMSRADLVITGNSYLKERALGAGARNIETIPSVIDLDQYPRQPTGCSTGEGLVIGWIGTPATVHFLNDIKASLQALGSVCQFQFRVLGVPGFQMDGVNVAASSWSHGCEAQFLSQVDVGIMPLIDGPFERGKCGYKLIQYMAAGKPVIASPVGVNLEIVQPGTGLLATNQEEWLHALKQIVKWKKEGRLCEMGAAGRLRVEETYSLQCTAEPLWNILKKTVEKH